MRPGVATAGARRCKRRGRRPTIGGFEGGNGIATPSPRRPDTLAAHSLQRFVFSVPDLCEAAKFYRTFGLDVREVDGHLDLHAFGHPHRWGSVYERNGRQAPRIRGARRVSPTTSTRFVAAAVARSASRRRAPHAAGRRRGHVDRRPRRHPVADRRARTRSRPRPERDAAAERAARQGRGAGALEGAAPTQPRRLSHVLHVQLRRACAPCVLSRRAGPAAVGSLGRHHRLPARRARQRPSHARVREVGRPGTASLVVGRRRRSTPSASAWSRWRAQGFAHGWGVGRHVIGSNYFRYVRDPWGSFAEYSADIDFIPADVDWKAGRPSAGGLVLRLGAAGARRFHHQSRDRGAPDARSLKPHKGDTHEHRSRARIVRPSSSHCVRFAGRALAQQPVGHADQDRQHARADRAAGRRPASCTSSSARSTSSRLNKRDGLLGRPVEWIVKDDQSKPDLARTLYEQLITVDKVDLLMGPYATGAILSAMGVAQRYNKMLIHHTFGIPNLAKYDGHFPDVVARRRSGQHVHQHAGRRARRAAGKPPKTVAVVTSKFPSVHFMSLGAREVAKKRGIQEVLFLEWEFGNRDFGPIAARVKDAKPDFVYVGAIGLEGNQLLDAMKKIDYAPPIHFYMYPAPGPMVKAPEARTRSPARSSRSIRRSPTTRAPPSSSSSFNERAAKAGLPVHGGRDAGRGVVLGVAGARRRGHRDQEPRRQGARRLAEEEQGRHDPGQAALRRAEQLRRRPDAREAGAERPLGHRVAEESSPGAGRDAAERSSDR